MNPMIKLITSVLLTLTLMLISNSNIYAQKRTTREVSVEAPATNDALVRITGVVSRLTVKSWNQSKAKITVQLEYDSTITGTDEELLESLGISLRSFSNRVDIATGRGGGFNARQIERKSTKPTVSTNLGNPPAKPMEYADNQAAKTIYKSKLEGKPVMIERVQNLVARHITVFVPVDVQLDIRNRYGDVTIAMNVEKAHLEISNGTLDAQDIKNLELVGRLCHANFSNIDRALVEFENGDLRAREIDDLDLDSKGATIEYEKGDYLYMRSQNDEIIIDEIKKVEGRKTYGNIRIDKLRGDFDLEGNNADVKLRDIDTEVKLIRINNKYADLRLPVRNLVNYFVDFNGYYSMVYAPFRKDIPREDPAKETNKADTVTVVAVQTGKVRENGAHRIFRQEGGDVAPHRFTSTVGDVKGRHTRFEIICNSCTLDFK